MAAPPAQSATTCAATPARPRVINVQGTVKTLVQLRFRNRQQRGIKPRFRFGSVLPKNRGFGTDFDNRNNTSFVSWSGAFWYGKMTRWNLLVSSSHMGQCCKCIKVPLCLGKYGKLTQPLSDFPITRFHFCSILFSAFHPKSGGSYWHSACKCVQHSTHSAFRARYRHTVVTVTKTVKLTAQATVPCYGPGTVKMVP